MNSKKIFQLELFLVLTLFLNQYFVFHGLAPSPLYWLMILLVEPAFLSVLTLLLVGIALFQCIYSYKRMTMPPIKRGVITLTLCFIYIILSTINQYIENADYIDLSLLTSIPFLAVGILLCLEFRKNEG